MNALVAPLSNVSVGSRVVVFAEDGNVWAAATRDGDAFDAEFVASGKAHFATVAAVSVDGRECLALMDVVSK